MSRPEGLILRCCLCAKTPEEIDYSVFKGRFQTDSDYVWEEEGTLDKESGRFLCDDCYIRAGQPSGDGYQWTATPENASRMLLKMLDGISKGTRKNR